MKRILCTLLCLVFLGALAGCDGSYKADMSFQYILSRDISTLDPQTASGSSAENVINSIFEGLCRVDEKGEVSPGVAKSWKANQDSTSFTFSLRGDAKWSNGDSVTAFDFVYGIQRALTPETGAPSVDDLYIIRNASAVHSGSADMDSLGIRAEDERTLVIDLESSYSDFPALTASMHYMPCNQEYFEASEGHYGQDSRYLITNGPFTFSSSYSWSTTDMGTESIGLVRSNDYRGEHSVKPAYLTYLVRYDSKIDDDPIGALTNGDIDIMRLSERKAKEAEETGCGLEVLDDGVRGLLLNPRAESLAAPAVREIFVKTLEREELLTRLDSDGRGAEAQGIMPDCVLWNGEPYYGEGESVYTQQDDSVTSNIQGVVSSLDMEKMPSITVICPDDEESIRIANGLLTVWNKKLSNAYNILPLSESDFNSRIANGDYDAALYTLRASGTSPYSVLKAFESTASPQLMEDSTYDADLHEARFSMSDYRELEAEIRDSYVFYPLNTEDSYYAVNPKARDISVSPGTGLDFSQARKQK